jgi:Rrf2 family protein
MKLTQESRHALSALVLLAKRPPGAILSSAEIASGLHTTPGFISKILQRLRRAGIIAGHRGAVRGYSLARRPAGISVTDVTVAVEGGEHFRRCIFWSSECSDRRPCILHDEWSKLRPRLESRLASLSIADLADRRASPSKSALP